MISIKKCKPEYTFLHASKNNFQGKGGGGWIRGTILSVLGRGEGSEAFFHFYNEMNFLGVNFPGGVWTPPFPRSAHRTYQSFYRILNRNKKNNCSYMYQIRFFNSTPNITKIHMYTNFKNNHWRTIYSFFFFNVQCRKQQLKYSRCSTVCLLNIYSIIPIMSPEL